MCVSLLTGLYPKMRQKINFAGVHHNEIGHHILTERLMLEATLSETFLDTLFQHRTLSSFNHPILCFKPLFHHRSHYHGEGGQLCLFLYSCMRQGEHSSTCF